ncbi:MAG: acetylornithine deacetylase [Gammaproteobacteria bacterium]|nr:acetylornithine deacetylase [Gammaproteobacteria bacterium]
MNKLTWLTKLIAFDTTSSKSNLDLIDCLADYLQALGFEILLTYHPKEAKANLLASLPGELGIKQGGLILSGHTDVVPVTSQPWSTLPFLATQIDNSIYGRGACDMKGFLAVILALAKQVAAMKLKHPLHLAFSFNEEVGCDGVPLLIEEMKAHGIAPAVCIVGEPTSMRPVLAHKGIQSYRCQLKGVAVHSSLTLLGCNAIYYAAEVIQFIHDKAKWFEKEGTHDMLFDVPFSTLSVNQIQGGIANNIVPSDCELTFDFRNLPEDQPELFQQELEKFIAKDLMPRMQKDHATAKIELEKLASVPAFAIEEQSAFYQQVCRILGTTVVSKVGFATEAGLFQQANIETVVCGPGSIEQAHRPDEFIRIEQLDACEKFLTTLIQQYCVVI